MKKISLTAKLVLGGAAIALMSVLSISIVATHTTSNDIEAMSRQEVHRTAQDISELVQMALSQEMNMAKEIAVGNNAVDTAVKVEKEGKRMQPHRLRALNASSRAPTST